MSPEWQPIETAPRDGTCVLLYFPDGCWRIEGNIGVGFYSDNAEDVEFGYRWFKGEADSNAMTDFGEYPTHWMPLPAPPAARQRG